MARERQATLRNSALGYGRVGVWGARIKGGDGAVADADAGGSGAEGAEADAGGSGAEGAEAAGVGASGGVWSGGQGSS